MLTDSKERGVSFTILQGKRLLHIYRTHACDTRKSQLKQQVTFPTNVSVIICTITLLNLPVSCILGDGGTQRPLELFKNVGLDGQLFMQSFSLSSLQVVLGFPRDENIFNAAINPDSA